MCSGGIENPLDILMIEGRGWKHILNVLYPAFLGVSLSHEIESSPFEMSLDSRHCNSQAQLCLDALSLDTWLDMGVTLSCKHLLSTHYALLSVLAAGLASINTGNPCLTEDTV